MIYNNLIYFLTAIFLFSMADTPIKPTFPVWQALPLVLLILFLFDRFVRSVFRKNRAKQSVGYFKAEKYSAIAALLAYTLLVFPLDLRYYLSFLSFGNSIPALVNIGGLVVFLTLFVVIWRRARESYEIVFARRYRPVVFILSNIKANLPIVIPWMILTLCYDLISFIEWPWLQQIIASPWGDVLFFGTFLLFVFIFFPPLVKKLWGCKKIEDGPLREHLNDFCKRQNFSAELYIWPLFEGRVITAGVMGVIPGLRYILITPALLETMSMDELDSVMAHEIGHVKRFHLILYVLLIGSFAVSAGILGEPLFYYFFAKDFFYNVVSFTGFSPDTLRNVFVAVPSLLFLLLFFRYIFGYFMRNFERQADLHVIPVLGNSSAIISAFEKIAILSGNIRDQPSWHHFGIGQRIDFLKSCEKKPELIPRHHRKVRLSLLVYGILLASALIFSQRLSFEESISVYDEKYTRADLLYNAHQEEYPAHWLFFAGNYLLEHKLENRAMIAFDLAIDIAPDQPDILNNYAWTLLTSKEVALRDPDKALELARRAAELDPSGIILDTLATAMWANGYIEEAVNTEQKALLADPEKALYYQSQINRFQQYTYQEELQNQSIGDLPAELQQLTEEKDNGLSRGA